MVKWPDRIQPRRRPGVNLDPIRGAVYSRPKKRGRAFNPFRPQESAMRRLLAWMVCAVGAALATLAVPGLAQQDRLDPLRINHPYARATPPGAKTGGVFLTVDNASNSIDRLLRASTPIAAGVVVQQMVVDGGVMKMRAVPSVEVRAGGRLELKPGGYRLMLLDLKQPLKAGEKFPLTLTFERGGTILVTVSVEDMDAVPEVRR
jgi:copper(I)-binding protein